TEGPANRRVRLVRPHLRSPARYHGSLDLGRCPGQADHRATRFIQHPGGGNPMKVRNLVLFVPVLALLASACGDDEDDSFDASLYAGTYAGTWTNTGNGTTGPATIAITVDEKAKTASLTLDFG